LLVEWINLKILRKSGLQLSGYTVSRRLGLVTDALSKDMQATLHQKYASSYSLAHAGHQCTVPCTPRSNITVLRSLGPISATLNDNKKRSKNI